MPENRPAPPGWDKPYSPEMQERLDNNFTHHPPTGTQKERYEILRAAGKTLAEMVAGSTPSSREQSLSLSRIEEAIMWANAAIARNEK